MAGDSEHTGGWEEIGVGPDESGSYSSDAAEYLDATDPVNLKVDVRDALSGNAPDVDVQTMPTFVEAKVYIQSLDLSRVSLGQALQELYRLWDAGRNEAGAAKTEFLTEFSRLLLEREAVKEDGLAAAFSEHKTTRASLDAHAARAQAQETDRQWAEVSGAMNAEYQRLFGHLDDSLDQPGL